MTIVSLPTKTATIGGSDAAAACGIDPHRSQLELWLNKRHELDLGWPSLARPETEAMRWGKLLEPLIISTLRSELHYQVERWADALADSERPWLIGHPDGWATDDDEGSIGLLEVNTVGQWAARTWHGEPPHEYQCQVQHYLHLTGLDRALLAVLVGGQRLVTYELERDQHAIDRLLELEERFYLAHLAPQTWDTPPEPDSSESAREALAAMFPPQPGRLAGQRRGVIRLTGALWQVRNELVALREQRKAVEAQERKRENVLKLAMGEAEVAISPHDEEVITWAAGETTRLAKGSVERLKAEWPQIYHQLAETKPSRRFAVL